MDLYSVFNTFWGAFIPSDFAVILTVLSVISVALLGYLIVRALFSIFIRGKNKTIVVDCLFAFLMACFIFQSFFPHVFGGQSADDNSDTVIEEVVNNEQA